MLRILFLMMTLMVAVPQAEAQKKEISQARDYIKSGKDLEKAEDLMAKLLQNPQHRQNLKIHATLYDAVEAQYEAANKRLYLHQKQDTAAFFNLLKRLYLVGEALDSVDAMPDAKGKVKITYRNNHAETLTRLMPNLYAGGTFFLKKQQWQQAFSFFETHIDCYQQPLLANALKAQSDNDNRKVQAAYWALYSAHNMKDPVLTLRHRELALQEQGKRELTLQFIAEAWLQLKDDSMYQATLKEGFEAYPLDAYFYPRLTDCLTSDKRYEEALSITDKAIEACDTCRLFLFAKSNLLLNLGRNDEAYDFAKKVAGKDFAEAYFTAATALLNKVAKMNERTDKAAIQALYREAMPYMEQFRQAEPEEKERWAPALYRIYLNLNMGKQFDEIDQLLKK